MKSSTFLLIIAAMTITAQVIRPSDALFIAGSMALCSMYICRAIEKNGREL